MSIPILQIRELKLRVSNSNRAKIEPRLPDSRDHYLKQTVVISSLLVPNAITLAVLAAVHGKAASPVVGSLPLHKAEQFESQIVLTSRKFFLILSSIISWISPTTIIHSASALWRNTDTRSHVFPIC